MADNSQGNKNDALIVLVAGNEPDLHDLMERWSQSHGAIVHRSDNPQRRVLRERLNVSAVVLDSAEPHPDRALAALAVQRRAAIVYIGRSTSLAEEAAALRAGADAFVGRPLEMRPLELALAHAGVPSAAGRAYPLFGPFSLIPAQRTLISGTCRVLLSPMAYELVLLLSGEPGCWIAPHIVQEHFGWRLSGEAAEFRLRELTRRTRRALGSHAHRLKFSRRLGLLIEGPDV